MKKINSLKPLIIVSAILLIAILGAVVYARYFKTQETVALENGVTNNTIENNTLENKVENKTVNNTTNTATKEDNKSEDKKDNTVYADDDDPNKIPNVVIKRNYSDEQKKAMEIVRKDWGEDDTVTIAMDEEDGKTGDEHSVKVIDNKDGHVILYYQVNTKTGTFEK
ncbi:MAG: hypothetical protein ACLU8F_06360 [Clostridia bacterium]